MAEIDARLERVRDGVYEFDRIYSLIGLPSWIGFFLAYRSLVSGSTAYLFEREGENFLKMLIANNVQEVIGSPAQLSWLSNSLGAQAAKLWSLKMITSLGGAITIALLHRLRSEFRCEVSSVFGTTESSRVAYSEASHDGGLDKLKVFTDTEVQVVDSDGRPLPVGAQGILRVRSAFLASNYIKKNGSVEPVHTDGWFYPGDQANLDESGFLTINHRDSDVTTVGGARVNLMVVEQALIDSGMVDDCKCLVFELPEQALEVLAIAFESGSEPSNEDISRVVWGVLPEKLSLILHPMLHLPRNPSGKIGYQELELIEQDLKTKLV
jgi:acyl-coenzyme A synthetase/AMP-(fatty) acid ligase